MEALSIADIVLLFYTTAARISQFIQEKELPVALERASSGRCTLIWVPLERRDLEPSHHLENQLSRIQCGTRDATPIYQYDPHQVGWMQVEESIRNAVAKRRQGML